MNNIFSLNRFGLYVCQYFGENWKKLLSMFGAIIGCYIFVTAILPALNGTYSIPNSFEDPMHKTEVAALWAITFCYCAVTAGQAFQSYENKNRRFSLLTLPASSLEKFSTYLLFYVVLMLAICVLGIIFADYVRVWTAPLYAADGCCIQPLSLKTFFTFGQLEVYSSGDEMNISQIRLQRVEFSIMASVIGILLLQSFFFLTSSIWPKNGRVRGILCGIGILIAWGLLVSLGSHVFFPKYVSLAPRFEFETSFRNFMTISYATGIITILINYSIAYLRYRELETINRW